MVLLMIFPERSNTRSSRAGHMLTISSKSLKTLKKSCKVIVDAEPGFQCSRSRNTLGRYNFKWKGTEDVQWLQFVCAARKRSAVDSKQMCAIYWQSQMHNITQANICFILSYVVMKLPAEIVRTNLVGSNWIYFICRCAVGAHHEVVQPHFASVHEVQYMTCIGGEKDGKGFKTQGQHIIALWTLRSYRSSHHFLVTRKRCWQNRCQNTGPYSLRLCTKEC